MASSLFGIPALPDKSGAIASIELGEVVIRAAPGELRALGNHLLQAARELEAGVSQVESFVFEDPAVKRDTPLSVLIFGGGAGK
jgi:hypothetical protein